jgi:uroporphyrinogen III methyltransferase/synthase
VTVYLVGAGPGDPGLITVRGAEVLARADVVVHDRLADPSLLEMAPPGAELVDVGKRPGGPVDQERINRLLVERGRAGLEVVRLKGGDPFVFGRGGEEALALLEAGVDFEVVPGVTSASAVPAYAGVPLTHRGLSASFTVVTGHSRQALDDELDWGALARAGGTLVVLMGVAHRGDIARRLVEAGRPPSTPVVAVTWGTRPEQRTVRTTLGELGRVPVEPPATVVIGEVAGLDLAWFERRPLYGWRVVVTRAPGEAAGLSGLLRRQGAEPVELPVIERAQPADGGRALREAAGRLASYEWVVFTSPAAVERLMAEIPDARAFGPARVAAVGEGTARVLAAHGVRADLVPAEAVAEGLLRAMPEPGRPGAALLWPRAGGARPVLAQGLSQRGFRVDDPVAYETVSARPPDAALERAERAQAVALTSGSTATGFAEAMAGRRLPPVVACIGPVTARAAERAGLSVSVVASQHSLEGLVEVLCQLARAQGPPRSPGQGG